MPFAKKTNRNLALGRVEYGDVYSELRDDSGKVVLDEDNSKIRDKKIGRLVVDFTKDEFWLRPFQGNAKRLTSDQVATLVANDLVIFDQPSSKKSLTTYLMKREERIETVRKAELDKARNAHKLHDMVEDRRLFVRAKRAGIIARVAWVIAMAGFVGLAFVVSVPRGGEVGNSVSAPTIEGEGQDYGVDSSLLSDATYIEAIGSATNMYGVITDHGIRETGDTDASTVKENILTKPSISSEPLHMRPLYYDKSSFMQTKPEPNLSDGSKTAIYLQNPLGYSLGVPANELLIIGGNNLAAVKVLSPAEYRDRSAAETASDIERSQQEAIQLLAGRVNSTYGTTGLEAGAMPAGWLGLDDASYDGERIAVSYWHTEDNSGRKEDLRRRIALLDVGDVLTDGEAALPSMGIAQLNYQDTDSQFYDPVVSLDPTSNGTTYLLAYRKRDYAGNEGTFLRRIRSNEDVLLEKYSNTFSTSDLTDSDADITNISFIGSKMFFEQSNSIWMLDCSEKELSIDVSGQSRVVKRKAPVEIAKVSEMRTVLTEDDKARYEARNETPVPTARYMPMALTTRDGIQYGIVFVEAESGNLVFKAVEDMIAASANDASGTGSDSTADGVYSGDAAAIREGLEGASSSNREDPIDPNIAEQISDASDAENVLVGPEDSEQESESQSNTGELEQVAWEAVSFPLKQVENEGTGSSVTSSVLSTVSGDEDTPVDISGKKGIGTITIRNVDSGAAIVAFTVRGDQVIWIEEDVSSGSRSVRISPIYYRGREDRPDDDEQGESLEQNASGDSANADETIESDSQEQQPEAIGGIGSDSRIETRNEDSSLQDAAASEDGVLADNGVIGQDGQNGEDSTIEEPAIIEPPTEFEEVEDAE